MRAFWAGTINFGLVNIPVKLYPASVERRLSFDYLHKKDLCPIGNVRVCKKTGEEVAYGQIVRGYEIQKGSYVVLEDEDFERANRKITHSVEIIDFVDEQEIPPEYFEKPYFIEPVKDAEKMYVLLCEALKRTGKVGIGRFVLKTQEHIGAIRPNNDLLFLDQMRYTSELKRPRELNIPHEELISERALAFAEKLIDGMSAQFVPERYHDTFTEDLKEIIEEKAKGKRIRPKEEKPQPTSGSELIDQLKASLEEVEKRGHRRYTSH
ncbi:Ku protein [Patescibacteria group bacterium]|nr:Ku protein [Patescibacteria group bacterium]